MKTTGLNILLLLLLSFSSAVVAALYRGLDAEGKVVYSDTPFESAEKFTPPPISVVDAPEVKKAGDGDTSENAEEAAEFRYRHFDITEPVFNQTLQNPEQLKVSLRLKPGLNTEAEHSIWLLMDKKPVVKNSRQTQFSLDRPERGAHELQAQVRDSSGKVVVRTRPVIVFIQRRSVR